MHLIIMPWDFQIFITMSQHNPSLDDVFLIVDPFSAVWFTNILCKPYQYETQILIILHKIKQMAKILNVLCYVRSIWL